jgi:hypothetical protein
MAMAPTDRPEREPDTDPDDLVERARELERRAGELEEEEAEVEKRERTPKEWLEHEPEHYWPPLEDDQDDDAEEPRGST